MPLKHLNMNKVFTLYQERENAHKNILTRFNAKDIEVYAQLALGIKAPEGNYSAMSHGLGPRILKENGQNAQERVFKLAEQLNQLDLSEHVPDKIHESSMVCLKLSVGSEMAMMLRPNDFWVWNRKTFWTHLLIQENFDHDLTYETFRARKDPGDSPLVCRALYLEVRSSLEQLAVLGNDEATKQGVQLGKYKYMWADAICNELNDNSTKAQQS